MIPIAEYKCIKHMEVNGETHSLLTTREPMEDIRPVLAGFRFPGQLELGSCYLLVMMPAEGSKWEKS